jgi:nucleotide-binding universal stress UspA family protein
VPRAILGSVAEEVLRRVAVPTVLVGPHVEPVEADDVGTIVACVDGSHLSEEALAPVARWAQQLGAPIELVHAIDPAMDEEPSDVSIDVVDAGYLSRLTRSMSSARRPDFEVLHGSAVNAIVDHVHEGVELVAMATHGRTGLARMALGSVALGVTHRARRPVLAVPSVAAVA